MVNRFPPYVPFWEHIMFPPNVPKWEHFYKMEYLYETHVRFEIYRVSKLPMIVMFDIIHQILYSDHFTFYYGVIKKYRKLLYF